MAGYASLARKYKDDILEDGLRNEMEHLASIHGAKVGEELVKSIWWDISYIRFHRL